MKKGDCQVFLKILYLFKFWIASLPSSRDSSSHERDMRTIPLSSFFNQYILFSSSIGKDRYGELNFLSGGILFDFKFIYLAFFPILFISFRNIIRSKKELEGKQFYYFLSLFFLKKLEMKIICLT